MVLVCSQAVAAAFMTSSSTVLSGVSTARVDTVDSNGVVDSNGGGDEAISVWTEVVLVELGTISTLLVVEVNESGFAFCDNCISFVGE